MVWFIQIYNFNCPDKKGEKCNHSNKMYRPSSCNEQGCPIKAHMNYID
jgi:hypothetical protein